MPTTHVEPGSEALLEEIANSLWKSKKVVVITGAGISTNSGIPVCKTGRVPPDLHFADSLSRISAQRTVCIL